MRLVNNLSRLLRDLAQDSALMERYKADAAAVTAEYGLSVVEADAIASGDELQIRMLISGRTECFLLGGHPADEEAIEEEAAA